MALQHLLITEKDLTQLRRLVEHARPANEHDRIQVEALEEEIERARVVPSHEIPPNVVTMHSRARVMDLRTGEQMVFQVVYPHEANFAERKISVLAPIGMALLGNSADTEIEWTVPSGTRRLRIEAVEHQPEAARRYSAA